MEILNSTGEDIETIFKLYDAAVAFQKTVFDKHWQGFDRSLIETEISENRQYKIVMDGEVACIFAVTFSDAMIWGELDKSTAIYIHRIVTNPAFRGHHFVKHIVQWAVDYGRRNGLDFVRMDTWGDNEKLISYYISCGFTFIGLSHEITDNTLPKHYQGVRLSLFEIDVNVLSR